MNISILTLHGANNIGAFLQAYSLQNVISGLPNVEKVSFIRFSSVDKKNSKFQKAVSYLKQRQIGKVLFKYRSSKKYHAISKELNVDTNPFDSQIKYDTVVVGSDEVWNVNSTNFTHYPQFFGKNINAKKIISYAASGNSTKQSDVNESNYDFSSFYALSVRDKRTFELVKTIDGREPAVVCDPTLLIDNFSNKKVSISQSNYILVYSYELGKKEILDIKSFAKITNKKLISVGTYNAWCDENIVVDPFEFLSWLEAADMVITSTFHGCVLSVKLNKEFAVYTHSKGNPINHKILDFLQRMGLENRDASMYSLETIFEKSVDYEMVNSIITDFKKSSMIFLKEALEIND